MKAFFGPGPEATCNGHQGERADGPGHRSPRTHRAGVRATTYESLWTEAVDAAVQAGHLDSDDVKVTTRLVLGMVNWVSRWYSKSAGDDPDAIADAAVKLVFPTVVPGASTD